MSVPDGFCTVLSGLFAITIYRDFVIPCLLLFCYYYEYLYVYRLAIYSPCVVFSMAS